MQIKSIVKTVCYVIYLRYANENDFAISNIHNFTITKYSVTILNYVYDKKRYYRLHNTTVCEKTCQVNEWVAHTQMADDSKSFSVRFIDYWIV